MNAITDEINADKKLESEITDEILEFRTKSVATQLKYGEKAITTMRKYERAIQIAGSYMIDDQREYEQLMKELADERKDKEYWKSVSEEYKKKHGNIDTKFLDEKFSVKEVTKENDSDREAMLRYMKRKLNRVGYTSGNFTYSIKKN